MVGESFESPAARRRRKPVRCRKQAPVIVHGHFQVAFVPAVGDGMRVIPVEVHDHVLPAQAREMLGHVIGVPDHLFFGYVATITVIAVPAHGRGGGKIGGMAGLRSRGFRALLRRAQQPN
ncbi:MAG: hypothetical protein DMG24_15740 [Acidobacteria bacterium]|nr:MAG: hypothetical protein DMG24_15740 [Acidobacteriota bacterium]